jgi:ferritin-like metal-binding protein YciE
MALHTLEDLFVDHLKDIYNAEHQITKALPRMAKKVATNELREALENHLQQTETQIERLEKVFQRFEKSPRGKKCLGMEGLIQEGQEVLNEDMEPVLRDSAIIAAAQKVEHYEISAYGTAIAFARLLGDEEAVRLFKQTMDEESQADELLSKIAEGGVNRSAMQQSGQGQMTGQRQRTSQPQGSRVPEGQSQSQSGRKPGGSEGSQNRSSQ